MHPKAAASIRYGTAFGAGFTTMFLLAAHTLAWQGKRRKADARAIELLSEQLSERTRILKSFYDYAPADVIALVTHDNDQ